MSDVLITQFAVGPTHKARLLHNLLNFRGYDFFDVYILTDTVEFFAPITHLSNIKVADVNEARKDHSWSLEHEPLPEEKYDEAKYAVEFMAKSFKIPTTIRRFAFLLEKKYHGYIFMDCDIIPVIGGEYFKKLNDYFTKGYINNQWGGGATEGKIVALPASSPGYDAFHHPYLMEYAQDINNRYKVTGEPIRDNFISTDGNFRTLKFPDKGMVMPFFDLLNSLIHDILVDGMYFHLRGGSIWNVHSEYLLSIILNLMGAVAYPQVHEIGLHHHTGFRVDCYPEDRYWNWGQHFDSSMIGKMDFVQKNYEKLKTFYTNRGQTYPY